MNMDMVTNKKEYICELGNNKVLITVGTNRIFSNINDAISYCKDKFDRSYEVILRLDDDEHIYNEGIILDSLNFKLYIIGNDSDPNKCTLSFIGENGVYGLYIKDCHHVCLNGLKLENGNSKIKSNDKLLDVTNSNVKITSSMIFSNSYYGIKLNKASSLDIVNGRASSLIFNNIYSVALYGYNSKINFKLDRKITYENKESHNAGTLFHLTDVSMKSSEKFVMSEIVVNHIGTVFDFNSSEVLLVCCNLQGSCSKLLKAYSGCLVQIGISSINDKVLYCSDKIIEIASGCLVTIGGTNKQMVNLGNKLISPIIANDYSNIRVIDMVINSIAQVGLTENNSSIELINTDKNNKEIIQIKSSSMDYISHENQVVFH